MIFYFSGTGNSLWVAKELSNTFNEKLLSIADEILQPNNHFSYPLEAEENVFFVFPVHSWGPAVLMLHFIEKLSLTKYKNQQVYFVCTCGDNCGLTNKIIQKALHKKGITLTKGYSIQMPNNYILMQGFNTDTKEVELEKLQSAPTLLQKIIDDVSNKQDSKIYTKGKFAFLKSNLVYPLFRKFAIKQNRFYAKDNCTGCNTCVNVCPTQTITLVDNKPVWNNTCVQCTACIHRCPVQAIEYGKISVNKGRYKHPSIQ